MSWETVWTDWDQMCGLASPFLRALLVAPRKVVEIVEEWLSYRRLVISIPYTPPVSLVWNEAVWLRAMLSLNIKDKHWISRHSRRGRQCKCTGDEVSTLRGPTIHELLVCLHWSYNLQNQTDWCSEDQKPDSWLANRSCPDFIHQKSSFPNCLSLELPVWQMTVSRMDGLPDH